jgi:hypothetical protein
MRIYQNLQDASWIEKVIYYWDLGSVVIDNLLSVLAILFLCYFFLKVFGKDKDI